MMESVAKIKRIEIYPSTVYIFFSMYLCRKVFFSCRIINMNNTQEKELMRIYEPIILKKIGLGEKFPRLCLYSRRSALGIGLLKPTTILAILALKLYVGHKRLNTKISRMITINEQMQHLQNGYNIHPIETPEELKIKQKTWSDEIGSIIRSRNLKFANNNFKKCEITQN